MKKNIYKLIVFVFAMGMFTFSCDETNLDQPEIDLETSQDNALTENAVGDVFSVINDGLGAITKSGSDCPTIILNLTNKVMTITYPESGCVGPDGNTRTGVITATFNPSFQGNWAVDSYVTITFTNYSINGKLLEGTMIATCTALEPNPVFTLSSNGLMSLTFSDEKSIIWQFENDYTMLTGFSSQLDRSDDTWQIDGTSTGTARNGKSFLRESIGLTTSNECKYFVSGTFKLTIDESDLYKLDFTKPCGTVVITYKGITINQTLQ